MSGPQPVLLVARERRGRFGRAVKWAFWIFQLVVPAVMLGTCAFVAPYLQGEDPEVAMGAGMFGAVALGALWLAWPAGTVLLGLALFLTRGRKRLIPDPSAAPAPPAPATAPARRPGGSVPPTGGGGRPG